ncbi:unnamed protein product [Urochloa humidicola]
MRTFGKVLEAARILWRGRGPLSGGGLSSGGSGAPLPRSTAQLPVRNHQKTAAYLRRHPNKRIKVPEEDTSKLLLN